MSGRALLPKLEITYTCAKCGPLPVDMFYATNKSHCKTCLKAYNRKWRKEFEKSFGKKYR